MESQLRAGYYVFRDKSGLPVIVGCVVVDREGNIARGMSFYKYEPGWQCDFSVGARGALWSAMKAMVEKRNNGHFNSRCKDIFCRTKRGRIVPILRDAAGNLLDHNMNWMIDRKGVIRKGQYNPPILNKKEKKIVNRIIKRVAKNEVGTETETERIFHKPLPQCSLCGSKENVGRNSRICKNCRSSIEKDLIDKRIQEHKNTLQLKRELSFFD